MHSDFYIALLLFAWVSTGLTAFTALDAATRLPGGLTITKRRNWRIVYAVILDIGPWLGFWLGQLGLRRQVGAAVSTPIVTTLMIALAASLVTFSIVPPKTSAPSGVPAP